MLEDFNFGAVHPELQALAEGYYENPHDLGRAGIIADWLADHDHPMADTYAWYLQHGLPAVTAAGQQRQPRISLSTGPVYLPVDDDAVSRASMSNRARGITSRGDFPLAHLFAGALRRSFRPHGPIRVFDIPESPNHTEGVLLPQEAVRHEMTAIGVPLKVGGKRTARPEDLANFTSFASLPAGMRHPDSRISEDSEASFHLAVASFLNRHQDHLYTHDDGTTRTRHQLSMVGKLKDKLRLARSAPLWVPRETTGREDATGYVPVDSSWIAGLKFTPERGSEMTVKKGGKNYSYPGLSLEMFRRWVKAKSKGKWWWRNVGRVMQGQPKQLSRWTGPVHPMFANGADGPIQLHQMSSHTPEEALEFLQKHVSPHATPEHLAALVGWLPGTTTSLRVSPGGIVTRPHIEAYTVSPGNKYVAIRSIYPTHGQQPPQVVNESIDIDNAPDNPHRGAAAALLLRQTRAAYELGIPRIKFTAAWSKPHNAGYPPFRGGLFWPMIGANGYIPESYVTGGGDADTIPPGIVQHANMASRGAFLADPPDRKTFENFFKSHLARAWYRGKPFTHEGFVDTAPGSYSRRAIERHVTEQATKHGLPAAIPDEQMPKAPLHMAMPVVPPNPPAFDKHQVMLDHLFNTGSLHPDFHDEYFEN